jgi:hypothetical protein
LLAVPTALINGLADHPQQAALELHYSVPALALIWVNVPLGLERLARWLPSGSLMPLVSAAIVAGAIESFASSSPFAPGRDVHPLEAEHRLSLKHAVAMIPATASVEAQSTILPHLSSRRAVFEFPDAKAADYVIVDAWLPVTSQSFAAGHYAAIEELPGEGYELVFDSTPVRVFRRNQ